MYTFNDFYINGEWVKPQDGKICDVINPATEQSIGTISLGNTADVDLAVAAANKAFETYSQTSREDRIALLERIKECYTARYEDVAQAISQEMGAPITFSRKAQAGTWLMHLEQTLAVLRDYEFEEKHAAHEISKEPVGVCGFITPWNWPINQIACKVIPALAAGCTCVLKPSEIAPISAAILTEILHEAGVPAGVYNMVNGDGAGVGAAISAHPDLDMVSFTGSTRAGVAIAKAAADTVKRVAQELGGKSANIILEDADIAKAVARGVKQCFGNTGQSCNAPTRMLVPEQHLATTIEAARAAAERIQPGDSANEKTVMGPVVSELQFNKIQALINKGIEEGAELIAGGPGKPEGLETGYFIKPTVFANVTNDMTIAREEIFGPVLSIMTYKDEDEAIAIANDTEYGLAGYVSGDVEHAKQVAKRIRAGNIHINGKDGDGSNPFGGFKQSGNGREWGVYGFEEFLEVKAVMA